MLLLLVLSLVREHNTTKEIKENCGWGDEDYYCYCKYDDVEKIDLILNPNFTSFSGEELEGLNVSLAR